MGSSRQAGAGSAENPRQLLLAAAVTVAVLVAMTVWAGLPPARFLPQFILGVAVLIGVMLGFGGLVWHLLLRPLPAGQRRAARPLGAGLRRLLVILLAIACLNLIVGGFWDEVWHRQYGVPFGEDLLWRPHLLIYTAILTVALITFGGLAYLLRRSRGTLQQRFRSDPVIGLLALMGGFLMIAVPADPLWHIIYGEDISAWSLPHLLLVFAFSAVIIGAGAVQLSTLPVRRWQPLWRVQAPDLPLLFITTFLLLTNLQVLVTDWDASSRPIGARPDWLLPAVLAGFAAFVGLLALHALRTVGAATVTALLALAARYALMSAFDFDALSAGAWLAMVPPMVALDAWYGWRVLRGRPPAPVLVDGAVALLGMGVTLALLGTLFDGHGLAAGRLWLALPAVWLAASGGGWLGRTVGGYLATANKFVDDSAESSPILRVVPPVALVVVVLFIVVFVTTATAPV